MILNLNVAFYGKRNTLIVQTMNANIKMVQLHFNIINYHLHIKLPFIVHVVKMYVLLFCFSNTVYVERRQQCYCDNVCVRVRLCAFVYAVHKSNNNTHYLLFMYYKIYYRCRIICNTEYCALQKRQWSSEWRWRWRCDGRSCLIVFHLSLRR